MAILVTGGAGYIGSALVAAMKRRGEDVAVIDDLTAGHEEVFARLGGSGKVTLYKGSVGNTSLVSGAVKNCEIDACIHFAGRSLVGESVTDPYSYYQNNVAQGIALAGALIASGIDKFIFSSSAAVYGTPKFWPITETDPLQPCNPYGRTKLFMEHFLNDLSEAGRFRYVALRYFNAAGATSDSIIGEDHDPETHLIPNVIGAANGKKDLWVYGDDYPTSDGTAVRDYVHMDDLVDAHIKAIEYLREGGESEAVNIGTGTGNSVMEVINTVKKVTGLDVPFRIANRRPGDPPVLVADYAKAESLLGWRPTKTIEDIVSSAWKWHQAFPNGYGQNKGAGEGPLDNQTKTNQ